MESLELGRGTFSSVKEGLFEGDEEGVGRWHPLLKDGLVGSNLESLNLLPLLRADPLLEAFLSTLTVVFVVGFLADGEVEKCRVASDHKLPAKRLSVVGGAIDTGHVQSLLVVTVELVPNWGEVLAVRAPWSEELNEPRSVAFELLSDRVEDQVHEVGLIDLDRQFNTRHLLVLGLGNGQQAHGKGSRHTESLHFYYY